MEEYPPVSIVVAVHNMEGTIGKCIKSLLEVDYPNKEIIVVDDGSTDKTSEVVTIYPVKLIKKEQGGVSSARNKGIEEAQGEILAFTDGDCIVNENWLKELVKHFSDPEVGGVGGNVIFIAGDPLTTAVSIEYEDRFKKRRRDTQSIACINATFRKEVFEKVGEFKKILGETVGGEDIEFSYRVKDAGYKLLYEHDANVWHDHTTMASSFIKRNYRNAIVSVQNYMKYRRAFEDSFFNPGLILQPLFFLGIVPLAILSIFIHQLRFLLLGTFLLALFWNIPLVVKTCRRRKDYSPFFYLTGILFLRGFVLAFGIFHGLLRSIRHQLGQQ